MWVMVLLWVIVEYAHKQQQQKPTTMRREKRNYFICLLFVSCIATRPTIHTMKANNMCPPRFASYLFVILVIYYVEQIVYGYFGRWFLFSGVRRRVSLNFHSKIYYFELFRDINAFISCWVALFCCRYHSPLLDILQ